MWSLQLLRAVPLQPARVLLVLQAVVAAAPEHVPGAMACWGSSCMQPQQQQWRHRALVSLGEAALVPPREAAPSGAAAA